jgi:rhamnosyltransferase
LKVAIIGSRGIPARYGGFETFAEVLAQGLTEYGHEVVVYSLPEFQRIPFSHPKIKRVFIKASKISSLEKVSMSSLSILHSTFSGRNDAIIFLGVSGGLIMWLPRLLKQRTIVNIDGLEWKRSRWGGFIKFALKTLERLSVKWSDVVIADSEAIGEYVQYEYKKEFVFIPYGIDEGRYKEEDWGEVRDKYHVKSGGYYLIVGRHVPENNFDISINGFLKSKSDKKLLIVSNFDKEDLMKAKNIIFTGPVYDRPKLYALRANAFAYIHGHGVGGTNPSLLEAISSKNIVLAYDVPYNREVLSEYGYYYKDEKELSRLIEFMEKDFREIDREKILNYYDKILREKYNWYSVIRKYESLLH